MSDKSAQVDAIGSPLLCIGAMEGWPSGLRRTLGKRVYVRAYRGFESHSLRQKLLLTRAMSCRKAL